MVVISVYSCLALAANKQHDSWFAFCSNETCWRTDCLCRSDRMDAACMKLTNEPNRAVGFEGSESRSGSGSLLVLQTAVKSDVQNASNYSDE
jgi:hypothetical protein